MYDFMIASTVGLEGFGEEKSLVGRMKEGFKG